MPGASFSWSRSATVRARRGEVAGGRRHQRDATDTVTEQLRPGGGQAHDRHATHGVPAEHHRPARGQLVQQLPEVRAELVDAQLPDVVGVPAPAGATVAALVIPHQAELPVGDPGREQVGDVVPGGLGQRPAVREDERDRCVVGPVDDGVQPGAVGRGDGRDAAEDGASGHAAASGHSVPATVPT
jgi:hypothetical protein